MQNTKRPRFHFCTQTASERRSSTYTLTDSNGVLSPDFTSFSAPSGITVTKNGNTLTITATEAAMANGEVTVSMTGRKVNAGTTYVWFAVNTYDESNVIKPGMIFSKKVEKRLNHIFCGMSKDDN